MKEDLKHVRPFFRQWCHKIIPLIYDDALSYYELLGRLQKKINDVIDTVNGLIDADIEGYIKDLIDEYATEKVIEIINEQADPIMRELAEQYCQEFLNEYLQKLYNSSNVDIIGVREYFFDGWNAEVLAGLSNHKADGFLIDNTNYYYFVGKTIFTIDKASYNITYKTFPEFTATKMGHVTHNDDYFIVSDGDNRIYFIGKSSMNIEKTYTTDSEIGSVGYDRTTDILYAKGRMAEHTEESIYRIDFTEGSNIAHVVLLGSYAPSELLAGHHTTVYQNICVHDGLVYNSGSNPNCIVITDTNGNIVQNVTIGTRLDMIMPLGELQGIDYYDGKIYIQGYSGVNISGVQHLNASGWLDLKNGCITQCSSFLSTTYAGKILYVDQRAMAGTSDVVVSQPNALHVHYTRYMATGWYGEYGYYPFATLWEAVEASAGFYDYYGAKSVLRIADSTNLIGSCRIPAYCIHQITGYHPNNGNIYWRCRGMSIYDGNIEIIRCGFTGMRGHELVNGIRNDIGYEDDASVLEVSNAHVKLTSCNILYSGSSVLKTSVNPDIKYFVKTSNCGYLEFGSTETPDNWGENYEEWGYEKTVEGQLTFVSHFDTTSGKYMYANSGIINMENLHDWQNTELFPYNLTRGGCYVGQMRMWNVSQEATANTGLVIPERTEYEKWHTFDIWCWYPSSYSYCYCLPVRGITTHAGNNRPVTINFDTDKKVTITTNANGKLVITPNFNTRIQIYLRKL